MKSQDAMRELIVSRGLGVVSAQGWSALSIGDLARDLDISRTSVLAIFLSPEALQLGVLEHAAACFNKEVVEPAQRIADGEARVRALFTRWIGWSRAPRLRGGCPFVHASNKSESLAPAVQARLAELLAVWSDALREAIAMMYRADGRADAETDQLVFELYGLYLSHHFWHWSMRDPQTEWRTMKAFDRLMRPAAA